RQLAGDSFRNKRGGADADRAVIMVDPFPDPIDLTTPYAPSVELASVAKHIVSAYMQQARFKPEELALAAQPDIFSRYMIAPVAGHAASERVKRSPMASAALGGFGGFLSEAFRHHDFQLGRRNCQRFLQRHFALYPENPLFGNPADPTAMAADRFNFED